MGRRPILLLVALLVLPLFSWHPVCAESDNPRRSLRVVMDNTYPPYVFLDSAGQVQGILADQWRLWQEKTGIAVEIAAMDWKDALAAMRAGRFDVIDTAFYTEERAGWLSYGKPYAQIDVAAFFNNAISGISDVESLQGFAVAVKEGDAIIDLLHRHGVTNLVLFKGYEEIVQAARDRKVNVFVIDKPPALHFLYKYGLQQRFNLTRPFHAGHFHRAVAKGNLGLLQELEAGFGRISPQELEAIERKWRGTRLWPLFSPQRMVAAGMVALGLVLGLFLWNRTLRRSVRKRTEELERSQEELRQNELRYRNLVEKANSIILRMDNTGRITFLNEFAQQFFGYRLEEVLGENVIGTIVPNTESTGRNLRDLILDIGLRTQLYATNENENMRRDGSRVWVAWTNKPLRNSAGEVTEILCVGNDITDFKRAEEALRRERERLELIIEGSRLGTWEWNIQTNQTVFNSIWAEMLGYTSEELQPYDYGTWARLVHPDDLPRAKEALTRCAEGLTADYDCEVRMRHKDGQWVWVLDRGRLLTRDSQGRPLLMFGTHTDISGIKRVEEELHRRERQLQQIFEILPIGLWFADREGTLLRGNPMGIRIWGAEPKTPISEYGVFKAWRLPSRQPVETDDWALTKTIREGVTIVDELLEIEAFDGQRKTILNYSTPVFDDTGNLDGAIVVNLDVSERQALEHQLLQAQKMESIGRLAGGVAHDFNNMLSVILGHAEMALQALEPNHPLRVRLQGILEAAGRSAALTQQLLAFARKQTVAPRVLDLNQTVAGMLAMLKRLMGENIDLIWLPSAEAGRVRIDPAQVDQILVNLLVNARDAIGDTGKITIETGAAVLDEAYCAQHPGFLAGDYVLLAVSDNGCGMDADTLACLFEPFFTTKEMGQGTGLGLATVYGIVKQNLGFINVYSEPGQGTTFRIYLPRHALADEAENKNGGSAPARGGKETILLVEDEPMILEMVLDMLAPLGYRVLSAATPGEALKLAREHDGPIDLLLTDVVMPEMNGRDLARELGRDHAGIRVLFMSGYTANAIAHHGVLDEGVHFIQKPFALHALAAMIRQALGDPRP